MSRGCGRREVRATLTALLCSALLTAAQAVPLPPPQLDPYVCAAFCPAPGDVQEQRGPRRENDIPEPPPSLEHAMADMASNAIRRMAPPSEQAAARRKRMFTPSMCAECWARRHDLAPAGDLQRHTGLHYNEYFDYQPEYYVEDENPMMEQLLRQLVHDEISQQQEDNRSKKD